MGSTKNIKITYLTKIIRAQTHPFDLQEPPKFKDTLSKISLHLVHPVCSIHHGNRMTKFEDDRNFLLKAVRLQKGNFILCQT